jgi:hypothetical protein
MCALSWLQGHEIAEREGLDVPVLDAETQAQCKGRTGGFDIFMDVMFWLDIILTFRTGVIDNRQVRMPYAHVPKSNTVRS